MLEVARIAPVFVSTIRISPERPITTSVFLVPVLYSTVFTSSNSTRPANFAFGSRFAGGTTHVEGTQCKLCSRLTDGLSGDHTYSFSFLHHASGGKVTA